MSETRDAEFAREIALRLLTVRPRTRVELTDAMAKRDVPAKIIDEVLERFAEVGLVDDVAFAEQWARSRRDHNRLSARAVQRELMRKGVASEIVAETLIDDDPEREYRNALELARKKARTTASVEPSVAFRRVAAALARKGFGADVVYRATREALGAAADDPGDTG